MNFRLAAAGAEAALEAGRDPTRSDAIQPESLEHKTSLENYIRHPKKGRLGICCSGGGIRSASYSLGALQVARNAGVLAKAEYLAAVSGGCYTSVAHTTIVATTGGDFRPLRDSLSPEELAELPERTPDLRDVQYLADEKRIERLNDAFGELAPWTMGSPEERNLRTRPGYLASGPTGWIWLAANMLYGIIRHLLPFAAGIVVAGGVTGFVLNPWVPIRQEQVTVFPALIVALILLGVAGACLWLRQWTQTRPTASDSPHQTYQTWAFVFIGAALTTLFFLVLLPEVLVLLRGRGGTNLDANESVEYILTTAARGTAGLAGIVAVASFLARRGLAKRLVSVLTLIAGPLLVLTAYIGITYWATLHGLHWNGPSEDPWPLRFVLISLVVILGLWFVDEVTANMHLFYRERLSTIFAAERVRTPGGGLEHTQPPWSTSLYFSDVRDQQNLATKGGPISSQLPKLVVCASVTLSDGVPPGRNAASFTFEKDWSGGPATGYAPTRRLEKRAGPGTLTLPAMMAISGAALAPSMGRRTRPGMRLLLAMFNIRLGAWIPNPHTEQGLRAPSIREALEENLPLGAEARAAELNAETLELQADPSLKRPGAFYVLREALGLNPVRLPYVYATDGGHWENLGLVELLRRGCTQILCFDASGDDAGKFHTLSNAISLARSDLGVIITIKTHPLLPNEDGVSSTEVIVGDILYPDGTEGTLIYAKALLRTCASPDLKSFQDVDPKFPNHTTADQFFDERKYESYRALGYQAALRAVEELNTYRFNRGYPGFASGDLVGNMPEA